MDETAFTIRLDLHVAADSLRGSARSTDREPTDFVGRLGMLCAIEGLVERAVAAAAAEHERSLR